MAGVSTTRLNLCRRSDSGVYFVKIKQYTPGGKSRIRRLSLGTTIKREAQRRLLIIEQDDPSQFFGQAKNRDISIPEFIGVKGDSIVTGIYSEWASKRFTRRTREQQIPCFRKFVRTLNDELGRNREMLSDITKQDIEDYITWMLDHGRAKETANDALRDIKSLFNHSINSLEVFTGDNPAAKIKKFRIDRNPPAILSQKQVRELIEVAKEYDAERPGQPRMEWLTLLAVHAGLRRNEIVNSDWSWFDFDAKTITIPSLGEFRTKSKKSRTLPMSKWILESMQSYGRKETRGYLFTSNVAKRNGGNIYRYDPRRPFKEVLRRAGLETINHFSIDVPVGLHTLRATFGSLRVQNGANLSDVSQWLGHHSIQVTEQHYLHLIRGYNESIDVV